MNSIFDQKKYAGDDRTQGDQTDLISLKGDETVGELREQHNGKSKSEFLLFKSTSADTTTTTTIANAATRGHIPDQPETISPYHW